MDPIPATSRNETRAIHPAVLVNSCVDSSHTSSRERVVSAETGEEIVLGGHCARRVVDPDERLAAEQVE